MKGKTRFLGIGLLLLTSWTSAAELPVAADDNHDATPTLSIELKAHSFSRLDATAFATSEAELVAILNDNNVRLAATSSVCGGQCNYDSCICSGSDACCDDVCDYGCGLCSEYPCFVLGEEDANILPGNNGGGGKKRP